jgi:NAD-dependent deacetylase
MVETDIGRVRAALARARQIGALTGAGISAESGIPTFRGEPDSLWENHRPEDLATPEAFRRDPALVWRWYLWRRSVVAQAKPNPGHLVLAQLARRLPEGFTLVTQNVDGLHLKADESIEVVELHGNLWRSRCLGCGKRREDRRCYPEQFEALPPACDHCGGTLRPDVVWFGETLDASKFDRAVRAAVAGDVFLVVGTSGVVQPAASLAALARENGRFVVEINPDPTPVSDVADVCLRGRAGEVLPELL